MDAWHAINSVNIDNIEYLFVVLLERGKILTGLAELALLHALTNIPVHKGTLGVHQIELVIKTRPRLSNRSGVAEHADGALHLGKIATRDNGGRLVVDANLMRDTSVSIKR